jgi:hypothetical protein
MDMGMPFTGEGPGWRHRQKKGDRLLGEAVAIHGAVAYDVKRRNKKHQSASLCWRTMGIRQLLFQKGQMVLVIVGVVALLALTIERARRENTRQFA